jgi:hypothetical protein
VKKKRIIENAEIGGFHIDDVDMKTMDGLDEYLVTGKLYSTFVLGAGRCIHLQTVDRFTLNLDLVRNLVREDCILGAQEVSSLNAHILLTESTDPSY